jgi:L-ribulose-5-phosphate 3-epimerase UlaE
MQVEIYERLLSDPEDGCSRLLGKVWGLPSNVTSHFRRQSLFKNKCVSLVKKWYRSSRILSLYLFDSFIFWTLQRSMFQRTVWSRGDYHFTECWLTVKRTRLEGTWRVIRWIDQAKASSARVDVKIIWWNRCFAQ